MLLFKCCRGKLITTHAGSKFHTWQLCGMNECTHALAPPNGCWSISCLFVHWLWFGLVVIMLGGEKAYHINPCFHEQFRTTCTDWPELFWVPCRAIISCSQRQKVLIAPVPNCVHFLRSLSQHTSKLITDHEYISLQNCRIVRFALIHQFTKQRCFN